MTTDDDSSTAIRTNQSRTPLEPTNVLGFTGNVEHGDHSMNEMLKPGKSDHIMFWFHLPWIISVGIMSSAILTYFFVHPWPEVYTESVLGIIVGGTAVASGSRAISLLIHEKRE